VRLPEKGAGSFFLHGRAREIEPCLGRLTEEGGTRKFTFLWKKKRRPRGKKGDSSGINNKRRK